MEQARKRDFPEFDSDPDALQSYTRTVALASRKQLCINDELRAKSKDLDNDCLEIMEGTGRNNFVETLWTHCVSAKNGKKRCPYLPPVTENTPLLDLRDQILVCFL